MATIRETLRQRVRRLSDWFDQRLGGFAPLSTNDETGMSTAEYAIGTVAACAFAAVLYKVITSGEILSLLTGVVSRALHVPF